VAEQNAIAEILGALDDKVELNRRINETLEAMARALALEKCWVIVGCESRAYSSVLSGKRHQGRTARRAGRPRPFGGAARERVARRREPISAAAAIELAERVCWDPDL
jgi:hypothetical protein